jgi:hypothetical protein
MPQSIAGQLQSIPMSPSLSQSLGRAQDFAREQSHRALMLEHLLLALTEDPDASGVLRACNVDIDRLGTDVSGYLGGLLDDMRAPPGTEPAPDPELMRVVEAARLAAQQSKRRAIDGAIVLAAIVGDAKSPAAGLLKAHGMTFEEAIRTLQKASAQARSKQYSASARPPAERPASEPVEKPAPAPVEAPAPAPVPAWTAPAPAPDPSVTGQTADDILAAARARIQQRSATAPPAKPEPKPSPASQQAAPSEPETLPLMSLSAFTATSGPAPPPPADLPPMLGRPHGPPGPAEQSKPPSSPPPPAGAASRPPGAESPPPLRAAGGPGEGPPRPPPMQGAPTQPQGGLAPPRLPERLQRVDGADGPGPPPRRPPPVGPNGALPGQRRHASDAARTASRPAGPARGSQRAPAGPLIEAIPRRMRLGVATVTQVRIGRDKVDSLMQLLTGNRTPPQPEATMARVLSVRLRAPDGGFAIEPDTPETRWIEGAGQPQDEAVAWQWEVTPLRRGRQPLQLLVSARTVTREGVSGETAPPDRTIEVVVRGGRIGRVMRFIGVLVLLAAGIGLGRLSQDKLAQDMLDVGAALINNVLGLLRTSGFLAG